MSHGSFYSCSSPSFLPSSSSSSSSSLSLSLCLLVFGNKQKGYYIPFSLAALIAGRSLQCSAFTGPVCTGPISNKPADPLTFKSAKQKVSNVIKDTLRMMAPDRAELVLMIDLDLDSIADLLMKGLKALLSNFDDYFNLKTLRVRMEVQNLLNLKYTGRPYCNAHLDSQWDFNIPRQRHMNVEFAAQIELFGFPLELAIRRQGAGTPFAGYDPRAACTTKPPNMHKFTYATSQSTKPSTYIIVRLPELNFLNIYCIGQKLSISDEAEFAQCQQNFKADFKVNDVGSFFLNQLRIARLPVMDSRYGSVLAESNEFFTGPQLALRIDPADGDSKRAVVLEIAGSLKYSLISLFPIDIKVFF